MPTTTFVPYTQTPQDVVADLTGYSYENIDLLDEGRINEDGEHVLEVVYYPGGGKSVRVGEYGENEYARWVRL